MEVLEPVSGFLASEEVMDVEPEAGVTREAMVEVFVNFYELDVEFNFDLSMTIHDMYEAMRAEVPYLADEGYAIVRPLVDGLPREPLGARILFSATLGQYPSYFAAGQTTRIDIYGPTLKPVKGMIKLWATDPDRVTETLNSFVDVTPDRSPYARLGGIPYSIMDSQGIFVFKDFGPEDFEVPKRAAEAWTRNWKPDLMGKTFEHPWALKRALRVLDKDAASIQKQHVNVNPGLREAEVSTIMRSNRGGSMPSPGFDLSRNYAYVLYTAREAYDSSWSQKAQYLVHHDLFVSQASQMNAVLHNTSAKTKEVLRPVNMLDLRLNMIRGYREIIMDFYTEALTTPLDRLPGFLRERGIGVHIHEGRLLLNADRERLRGLLNMPGVEMNYLREPMKILMNRAVAAEDWETYDLLMEVGRAHFYEFPVLWPITLASKIPTGVLDSRAEDLVRMTQGPYYPFFDGTTYTTLLRIAYTNNNETWKRALALAGFGPREVCLACFDVEWMVNNADFSYPELIEPAMFPEYEEYQEPNAVQEMLTLARAGQRAHYVDSQVYELWSILKIMARGGNYDTHDGREFLYTNDLQHIKFLPGLFLHAFESAMPRGRYYGPAPPAEFAPTDLAPGMKEITRHLPWVGFAPFEDLKARPSVWYYLSNRIMTVAGGRETEDGDGLLNGLISEYLDDAEGVFPEDHTGDDVVQVIITNLVNKADTDKLWEYYRDHPYIMERWEGRDPENVRNPHFAESARKLNPTESLRAGMRIPSKTPMNVIQRIGQAMTLGLWPDVKYRMEKVPTARWDLMFQYMNPDLPVALVNEIIAFYMASRTEEKRVEFVMKTMKKSPILSKETLAFAMKTASQDGKKIVMSHSEMQAFYPFFNQESARLVDSERLYNSESWEPLKRRIEQLGGRLDSLIMDEGSPFE